MVVCYDAYAPDIFQTGAYIAVSGGFLSIAVAIGMSWYGGRGRSRTRKTFGSARWATEDEARTAGLLGDNGVVLGGALGCAYLRHDGPEHVRSATRRPAAARASAWSCPLS